MFAFSFFMSLRSWIAFWLKFNFGLLASIYSLNSSKSVSLLYIFVVQSLILYII